MSRVDKPCALKRFMRLLRVVIGGGMTPEFAAAKFAVVESLLPSFTLHPGPPRRRTESRAVMARMSAHETMPGHIFSTLNLILSITSNPLTELLLGPEVFSPKKDGVSSNSKDPSHPLTKQSWKNKRRREAPMRGSLATARFTTRLTTRNNDGQLSL